MTVLLYVNQLIELLSNKIEKLRGALFSLEFEQVLSEEHAEYRTQITQDPTHQEVIQESLQFFSKEYEKEEIQTINLARVEAFVELKMQAHHKVDCLNKSQEYTKQYVHEFVQGYMETRAQEKAEKEVCQNLAISLIQQSPQTTKESINSTVDMNRFDYLRDLRDQIELEQVKVGLVKLIGSDEEERKMIAKQKEQLIKDNELLAEEKELVCKERELLAKQKEEIIKERGLLAEEKELMTKERKELERLMAEVKAQEEKFRALVGVSRESEHTEKVYQQVSVGSKRKTPGDIAENDETEDPSPKRHQKSRASTSKAVRCLPPSEPKITIDDLLQRKESHLASENMRVKANQIKSKSFSLTLFSPCRNWYPKYFPN